MTENEAFAGELQRRLHGDAHHDAFDRFSGVSEEFWLWANTAGYRQSHEVQRLLPGLPSEDLQHRFTGKAGDDTLIEAHSLAAEFKRQFVRHHGQFGDATCVLEFGCGWGRILRFFLKDVPANNLWGIDVNPTLLSFCETAIPDCNFRINAPRPPTDLPPTSFDLIYAYSVFTHLSEPAHTAWIDELHRLSTQDAIVILSLRPRSFVTYCAGLAADAALSHGSQTSLVGMFADAVRVLREYDDGRFCYEPYRSSSYGPDWGEACIPAAYIERYWSSSFELLDFIDDGDRFKQHIAVLRARR